MATLATRAGFLASSATGRGFAVSGLCRARRINEVAPKGSLEVDIAGAEPLTARWICDGRAMGRVVDGVLEATIEDDGSTLRLTRNSGALEVTTRPPANDPDWTPRYCGLNGTVAGAYFPVSPKPR